MRPKTNTAAIETVRSEVLKLVSTVPAKDRHLLPFRERARRSMEDYRNPAQLMVAAALVNQNRWTKVSKRLAGFRESYGRTTTIGELSRLLVRMTDVQVSDRILDWGKRVKHGRVKLLRGLVHGFLGYSYMLARRKGRRLDDYEMLRQWAREKNPQERLEQHAGKRIRGLGPKLVAWLRMFGGDFPTIPFDVYTKEGMARLGLGDMGSVAEFVADVCGVSRYALDKAFRQFKSQ